MNIGFIGLGNMGGPMAMNILEKGHTLVVSDIDRQVAIPLLEAGATWADTPKDVAQATDVILTSLPGPEEVEAVALGQNAVLDGMSPDKVLVELSSASPSLIRRIYQIFREQGARVLDAPISGGVSGARDGTVSIMVGGDEAVFQRIKPVLEAIGSSIAYVGSIGNGYVAKLVHNLVNLATRMIVQEGLTLATKAGLAPEDMLEVLRNGAFGKHITLNKNIPEIVFSRDFDNPRFPTKYFRKDVRLALELAWEHDVPMSMCALTEQVLAECMARGWGDRDSMVTFLLQEERVGVEVRPTRTPQV